MQFCLYNFAILPIPLDIVITVNTLLTLSLGFTGAVDQYFLAWYSEVA